ncbi:MAG: type II toxin-antitoxin system RelE/ParE family toxin [Planctomycetaceae bacterium]|jgi:plasmid stabilization system protein ParE|nr:type II toxin-antitoxin system RelE/ParE family toxin [Planctomycetaceae bacterium]
MSESTGGKIPLVLRDKAQKNWERIVNFYSERNGSDYYSSKLDADLASLLEHICQFPELGQKTKKNKKANF